jgi:hypothetical protein
MEEKEKMTIQRIKRIKRFNLRLPIEDGLGFNVVANEEAAERLS